MEEGKENEKQPVRVVVGEPIEIKEPKLWVSLVRDAVKALTIPVFYLICTHVPEILAWISIMIEIANSIAAYLDLANSVGPIDFN